MLPGLMLTACVSTFDDDTIQTANVLVVDGTLTDRPERQGIRLSRSVLFAGKSNTGPVSGASMEVLVNGSEGVVFRENATEKGLYEAPEGFRARSGAGYRLRLRTPDGRRYESAEERMAPAPGLLTAYDRFDARGIADVEKTRFAPAHLVYVDVQDPAGERTFSRLEWVLYERQEWCASCQQGFYNLSFNAVTNQFNGQCSVTRNLSPNNWFDYACLTPCWEILRSFTLNLYADTYSDGRLVKGQLAAVIPYYQRGPALVEIRQVGLSTEAYRYHQLLEAQTERNGGLADTPPAPLIGNVRSLDDDRENVAGYFGVSSVATLRYWLDRQNASGFPLNFFQLLNGRTLNPEPPSGPPPRPPLAVCVPGPNRTPVKPEGWR